MITRLKSVPWKDVFISLLFAMMLLYPYFVKDFLPIEHDTFFHLSRIQGLAEAIRQGDFLPSLYPYKNGGFGYASPLFYCDVLLYPAALIYLVTGALSVSYVFLVFLFSWISAFGMIRLVYHISKKEATSWIAGCAYLFSNYRITDLYVRGALGELCAMSFLPFVILSFYQIVIDEKDSAWKELGFSLFLVSISHNLSFAMTAVLLVILFLVFIRRMHKTILSSLFKGILLAFVLGAFFTLPMLEQTFSQKFYLHYYGANSDLGLGAMDFWQYFANKTIFGYSGNDLPKDRTMIVNIGYFLTFVPFLWLFVKPEKRKEHPFVTVSMILGYLFFLLPCKAVPWSYLSFLRILQFPWRLNMISLLLLCIPAAVAVNELISLKTVHFLIIAILSVECVYHVNPVLTRSFGITSKTTYESLLNGDLIDPYYSAFYVRIECAGGDYLPIGSPDFRTYSKTVKNKDGNDTDIPFTKNGNTVILEIPSAYAYQELELPLTYYKGYQVYETGDIFDRCLTYENSRKMVAFRTKNSGKYLCIYENTLLKQYSTWLSMLGFTYLYFSFFGIKIKILNHK